MNWADVIDKWILVYVAIAAGLAEVVMRLTPEGVTRKRFAVLATAVFAMVASFAHGWSTGEALPVMVWRGLIAIAVACSGYDAIKSVMANFTERKNDQ